MAPFNRSVLQDRHVSYRLTHRRETASITALQSPRARWIPRRPPFYSPTPRYFLFRWLHRASCRYLALRLSSIALSPGWYWRRGCSYAVAESSEHLERYNCNRFPTGLAPAMESGSVPEFVSSSPVFV